MKLKTALELVKNGELAPLVKLNGLFASSYKLGFIAALAESGCFEILKRGPIALDELMSKLNIDAAYAESFKAWLQVGVRLREIHLRNGRYGLSGISRDLAKANRQDALLAVSEEVAELHHTLILRTPMQLRERGKWTLSDQDGEMIARSSRILEPLQNEVVDTVYPNSKGVRLLEVGCGSGIYLKRAATNNPQLTAVGLELQAQVAEMARRNIANWGLADRVVIESGDVRQKDFGANFDIVTLYNNIYYFPMGERVDLLRHLKRFLKPDGLLVVTTGCQGGSLTMELLNLWGAATQGCDRLPAPHEMTAQMESAGYKNVGQRSLLPNDAFYAFTGANAP